MRLDLDLSVSHGAFSLELSLELAGGPVALVGPNGAGKTALLRLLAGAQRPDQGRVVTDEQVLVDTEAGIWTPPEARRVGYLPQGSVLFGHLRVVDNVAYGLSGPERRARAHAALATHGLAHLAQRRPRGLSGGEAQQVALVRALVTEPRLLLLDEPTASLDVAVRRHTRSALLPVLVDPTRLAVVVTHDVRDLVAWQPHIVALKGGRVVAQGELATLAVAPPTPFLAELLEPLQR